MEEKTPKYVQLLALPQEGANCGVHRMLLGFLRFLMTHELDLISVHLSVPNRNCYLGQTAVWVLTKDRHRFCLWISQLYVFSKWSSLFRLLLTFSCAGVTLASALPLLHYRTCRVKGSSSRASVQPWFPSVHTGSGYGVLFFPGPAFRLLHCPGFCILALLSIGVTLHPVGVTVCIGLLWISFSSYQLRIFLPASDSGTEMPKDGSLSLLLHRWSDPELQLKVWAEGESKRNGVKLPWKFFCICFTLFALM